jgi:DNA polymerase-1
VECFEGVLVETLDQLKELCSIKGSIVALDTETTGLTFYRDKIVGLSFSFSSKDGYYVPLRHQYGNLPVEEALAIVKEMIYNNKILMFNAIFDSMMLEAEGIDMREVDIFEIQSLVFCADSNVKGRNLKWASKWYLGRESPTFKQTLGTSTENFHFGYLLPYESVFYTASDSANTFGLYEILYKPLMDECAFIIKLDNALVKAMLNYYVRQPIYIDNKKMKILSDFIRTRILELERKIFLKLGTTVDLECVSYDGKVNTLQHGSISMSQ